MSVTLKNLRAYEEKYEDQGEYIVADALHWIIMDGLTEPQRRIVALVDPVTGATTAGVSKQAHVPLRVATGFLEALEALGVLLRDDHGAVAAEGDVRWRLRPVDDHKRETLSE